MGFFLWSLSGSLASVVVSDRPLYRGSEQHHKMTQDLIRKIITLSNFTLMCNWGRNMSSTFFSKILLWIKLLYFLMQILDCTQPNSIEFELSYIIAIINGIIQWVLNEKQNGEWEGHQYADNALQFCIAGRITVEYAGARNYNKICHFQFMFDTSPWPC